MPSASDIKAGAAFIELYLKDGKAAAALRGWSKKLKAFGTAATQMGQKLLAVSAGLGAPLIASLKVFSDFETQMAAVSTMLTAPEKHMESFTAAIRKMSEEYGVGKDTLAQGLYDILSASVPAEKALGVLAVSAKAAKAGISDTGTAADAITTILNSYGLAADRAGDVSDWLFSIVQKGKTTFAELAPSIGNIATIASSAGVGLDELGAMLATLTRNGVGTEESITAVNAVISSFLKPSEEAAKYAKALGFNMSSATLESEGLAGVMARIAKLPPDAISKLFPNVRALKGVLPALQDLEGFGRDVEAMAGRAGATEDAYAKMTNTIAHKFSQMKAAASNVMDIIGQILAKPLKQIAVNVTKFLSGLTEWISKNQDLIVSFAKIVAVVGAVGAGLIVIGGAAAAVGFVLSTLATVVSAAGAVLGTLATVLAAVASPAGLVVAAVAGIGIAVAKSTGAAQEAIGALQQKFAELASRGQQTFSALGKALAAGDLGLAVRVVWSFIKLEFQQGINWLKSTWADWSASFGALWTEAVFGLSRTFTTAWAKLKEVWVEVVSFLQKTWTRFSTAAAQSWDLITTTGKVGWQTLRGMADEAYDAEAKNNAELDKFKERVTGREEKKTSEVDEIESARVKARAEIDAIEAESLAELERQRVDAHVKRETGYAEAMRKQEEELAAAKREWQAALAEANALANEPAGGPATPGGPAPGTPEYYAAANAAMAQQVDAIRGSFSVHAFRDPYGGGPGKAADRTAKATEGTEKAVNRLVEQATLDRLALTYR